MNPYVTSVKALPEYVLEVAFETGEVRQVDVKPFLERGVFQRLKLPDIWQSVRVVAGSVEWDGGIDLSYDTLYLLGVPVKATLSNSHKSPARKVAEKPPRFDP